MYQKLKSCIQSMSRYELTYRISMYFLISMAVPGTYTYRASRGEDAYAVISGSYIMATWNLMTYITFAVAAVGFGFAWLGKRFEKRLLLLPTAVLSCIAVGLIPTMCATLDMMLEAPLMFAPPILGILTVISSLVTVFKR